MATKRKWKPPKKSKQKVKKLRREEEEGEDNIDVKGAEALALQLLKR